MSPSAHADDFAKAPQAAAPGGIAPLADLPLSEVCDVLYGAD